MICQRRHVFVIDLDVTKRLGLTRFSVLRSPDSLCSPGARARVRRLGYFDVFVFFFTMVVRQWLFSSVPRALMLSVENEEINFNILITKNWVTLSNKREMSRNHCVFQIIMFCKLELFIDFITGKITTMLYLIPSCFLIISQWLVVFVQKLN